jgi:alpha-1,2-mannosyltransferase
MALLSSSLPRSFVLRRALGFAVGVAAGIWCVWTYVDKLHNAIIADQPPHDLAVFLRAGSQVVHGVSPYAFRADETYAYPPLLAFIAAPFHTLGAGAATFAWMILSIAAIGLALWWLGLRDWRCYALALLFRPTQSALDLGTVGPLLLFAVGALWRWRDRVAAAGVAAGAGVALKLFLWPLVAWLAITSRVRAAVAGLAGTLALVLIPWAVIGFAGIGNYPGLLRHLSRDEASGSYSVVALVVRAHLPQGVGVVVSLVIAVALLAAAAWVARDGRMTPHDRDVATLTLALAAALAASPIVWIHYFILLLVPLALARPRLSALWLVPFAYSPLGETAWPTGDARKLALALVATLVLLVATLDRVPVVARRLR